MCPIFSSYDNNDDDDDDIHDDDDDDDNMLFVVCPQVESSTVTMSTQYE